VRLDPLQPVTATERRSHQSVNVVSVTNAVSQTGAAFDHTALLGQIRVAGCLLEMGIMAVEMQRLSALRPATMMITSMGSVLLGMGVHHAAAGAAAPPGGHGLAVVRRPHLTGLARRHGEVGTTAALSAVAAALAAAGAEAAAAAAAAAEAAAAAAAAAAEAAGAAEARAAAEAKAAAGAGAVTAVAVVGAD
jgi:hypothetical protein